MNAASSYLRAGMVMDKAAALNNDTGMQRYTYEVQTPYLNLALQDLRKKLQENNAPVTDTASEIIEIPAGTTSIPFNNPSGPSLPNDLIEIQELWESWNDGNNFYPMQQVDFIPPYYEAVQANQWTIWAWNSNAIKIPSANAINNLKIQYIRNMFMEINHPADNINVINADSYLEFRTAALLAEFVGEDRERANSLNGNALESFDQLLGITNKGRQAIATRRRPFRAGWKQRSAW